jgi:Flp pilus assembly protein TadB
MDLNVIYYVVFVLLLMVAWAIWQRNRSRRQLSAAGRVSSQENCNDSSLMTAYDDGVVVSEVAPQLFEVRVTRYRHHRSGRAGHRRRRRKAMMIVLGTIKAVGAEDAERQAQQFHLPVERNLRLHLLAS